MGCEQRHQSEAKNKEVRHVSELNQTKKDLNTYLETARDPSVGEGLNPYGLHDLLQCAFANSKKHSKR